MKNIARIKTSQIDKTILLTKTTIDRTKSIISVRKI